MDHNNIRSTMKYLIISTLGVIEKGSDVAKRCVSHGREQKADTYHQNMCQQVRNTRPDTVTKEVM
jgi:hypothetical protein